MDQDNDDIDCIGEWGEWSRCSNNCNTGVKSRRYNIIYPGLNSGSPCLFTENDIQYRDCNEHACNADCIVGDWGEWGECSEICDGGISLRKRSIIPPRYITFRYDTNNYDSCLNEQILETYYQVGSEEFSIPEITDSSISGGIGNILADRPKYKNKYGYVIVVARLGDTNNQDDQMVILTLGSEKLSRILDFSNIMAKLGGDDMIWDENTSSYKEMFYSNLLFHPAKIDANSSSSCISKYGGDLSFFVEENLTMEIKNITYPTNLKDIPPFTNIYCPPNVIYEESRICNVEECAINKHEIITENDNYIEIILNESKLSLRIPVTYESFVKSTVLPRRGPGGPDLILYEEDGALDISLNCSNNTELISQINCAQDDLYDCTKVVIDLENKSNNPIFFNEIAELLPNSTSISILSNNRKCNVSAQGYYLDENYNVKYCYETANKSEAETNQACIIDGENRIVLPRSALIMTYPINYRDIKDIVLYKTTDEDNRVTIIASNKNDQVNRECSINDDNISQYNCDIDSPTNECILDDIESINHARSGGNINLFEDLSEFFSTNRTIQIVTNKIKCEVPKDNYYIDGESNVKQCPEYNSEIRINDVYGYCEDVSSETSNQGKQTILTILISITVIGFIGLLLYLLWNKPSTKISKSTKPPTSIKYKKN